MLNLKKGDKVIVKGFTGIKLCVSEVAKADKKTITVLKKNGDEMVFDRKTAKQINVEEGKEKYANSVMEDDGSYEGHAPANSKKKAKKSAKAAPKKVESEEIDDEDDENEDEEEVKPVKKSKKPVKKSKKVIEDDDDDFEEVDEE